MKKLLILLLAGFFIASCEKNEAPKTSEANTKAEVIKTDDIQYTDKLGDKLMDARELYSVKRLGEPKLSPDGMWLLYSMTTPNVDSNKMVSDLYAIKMDGSETKQLTNDPATDFSAIWSPDGSKIAYLSTKEGGSQLWIMDFKSAKAKKMTNIANGIGNILWSPDGKYISFTSDVKVGSTVKEEYPQYPKANMRIYTDIPIRHWDEWEDENYQHLFIMPADGGETTDLMPGEAYDTPLKPFDGVEDIAWSPDGKEIAYTCKKVKDYATSTNSDVYVYDIASGKTKNISDGMPGYDKVPNYSPDGKYIAFTSQEHAGFESDRIRLMLYDRASGKIDELTKTLDQWVEEYLWTPDSKTIYAVAADSGTVQIYKISVPDGKWSIITSGIYQHGHGIDISSDGKTLVYGRQSFTEPLDFYAMNTDDGKITRLTNLNKDLMATFKKPGIKETWFTSTDGKKVQSWLIFPPDFDPSKKYPMITYLQGGPQAQVSPTFHYRWNMMLMASHGYVVMAANRRGVPGFGQAWNNAISKDWGGMPMTDYLAATDQMKVQSFINPDAMCALGASAGGYAAYWMEGHHEKRFKALIAHCGVFDLQSMYGSTEELWFPNWEYGGPYWDPSAKENYLKNSPSEYVKNWDTPILISTGEHDFRVPYTQSLEAFTAARAQGIPAEIIIFPNETHFISKSQEFIIWSSEFFKFLDKYCKKNPA